MTINDMNEFNCSSEQHSGNVINQHAQLHPRLPLLTVLHSSVNGVASTTNDITLGTTLQQSFHSFDTSQSAGHVQWCLPVIVQLIHPRAHTQVHDLSEDGEW